MKRRKFIAASVLSSTFGVATAQNMVKTADLENEIYELKSYELTFGGAESALLKYLKETLNPAIKILSGHDSLIFKEVGNPEPKKLWSLLTYPNFEVYQQCLALQETSDFIEKMSEYTASGKIYNRISSSLLRAFDGLKQMLDPIKEAGLFELRIYEGQNEDAVRRKIKMFNEEEITLFNKVGLAPIFFSKMIVGPYQPSLVYLLNFRDLEHRNETWNTFINHPEWKVMSSKDEYKNTVSNIRKIFLEKV